MVVVEVDESTLPESPSGSTPKESSGSIPQGDHSKNTNTNSNPKDARKGSSRNRKEPLPSAIEFEPPLACVRRLLKTVLPASTNVGKDASAAFARASGIFIIYLTACANDFAREHKRQTITANDVLAAIKELDFDEFTPDMNVFLANYRNAEKNKKTAKANALKAITEQLLSKSNNNSNSKTNNTNNSSSSSSSCRKQNDTNHAASAKSDEEDDDDDDNVDNDDDDDDVEEREDDHGVSNDEDEEQNESEVAIDADESVGSSTHNSARKHERDETDALGDDSPSHRPKLL